MNILYLTERKKFSRRFVFLKNEHQKEGLRQEGLQGG